MGQVRRTVLALSPGPISYRETFGDGPSDLNLECGSTKRISDPYSSVKGSPVTSLDGKRLPTVDHPHFPRLRGWEKGH